MKLKTYYQEQAKKALHDSQVIKKKIKRVSMIRVFLFVFGCLSIWLLHDKGIYVIILLFTSIFIPFLFFVKYHNHLFQLKEWHEARMRVYQEELQALQGDYTAFDSGEEKRDATHPYTWDLDVFGPHSLFQVVNRTCTFYGKQTLYKWFQEHLTNKQSIDERQQAIQELASHKDFRENFRTTGLLAKGKDTDVSFLTEWLNTPNYFSQRKSYRLLCQFIPYINLSLLTLGIIGFIPMNIFGFVFGCLVVVSLAFVKRITAIQQNYDKGLKILSTYVRLITLTAQQEMHSSVLIALKHSFSVQNRKAGDVLNILVKELDRLDLRNNQILYILLEGSLFWQVRQMIRIEQWKTTYGKELNLWMDKLGQLDALCSMGTFAFNHPDYHYPVILEKPFVFQAKKMGHPLMPSQQCVKNDVNIPARPYFLVITGANMAGKSTYLRTIGSNYLLACMGLPVCCTSLVLYPAQLMTSLCISDSLTNNESYFFAELKRLQQIINQLTRGEELFIILDEILRGTNSKDKQKGSFALLQQMLQLRANGIIATHDLLLGRLAEDFPHKVKNYCFEADIQDEQLVFSYKLREGISQNMNACFLMKKMGLIIND